MECLSCYIHAFRTKTKSNLHVLFVASNLTITSTGSNKEGKKKERKENKDAKSRKNGEISSTLS
jgi:hypothetical protein